MPRRAILVVNTRSRRGQEFHEQVRQRLSDGGLQIIEPESDLASCAQYIRQHRSTIDMIILGGGDGSINQALPMLLEAGLPVGVLPLGTANDLARTLGLPVDPLAACDVILQGTTKRIDVGLVNDRPFLNVASIGLAVEVTSRLSRVAKTRWGALAYVWAAMRALTKGRPFRAEIVCDGLAFNSRTWQIAVGNGRHYGGGLTIYERARIDDGMLDLCSVEIERGWHILWLIPALWRGTMDPLHTLRTMHGRRIEVRPLNHSRRISADGEIVGQTPAVFQVLPEALSVFVTHAAQTSDRT